MNHPNFFHQPRRQRRTETGFSLLEVLVALVIIAVGLLGLAGMNALAINNTSTARTRGLAATLAGSLSGAMAANAAYWGGVTNTGANSGYGPPPASTSISGNTLGDATLNGKTADCSASDCNPDVMAAYDLKQWGSDVAAQLPGGAGTITCSTTAKPYICTIEVSWTERAATLASNSTTPSTSQPTQKIQMVIQP